MQEKFYIYQYDDHALGENLSEFDQILKTALKTA